MALPRYHFNINNNSLFDNQDGTYNFDDGKRSYRLDRMEVALITSMVGNLTAKEIIGTAQVQLSRAGKEVSTSKVVKCMTSLLDKDLMQEVEFESEDWNTPLLITGCARTGTSALARTLSSHPEFCIFNEYQLYSQNLDFNIWKYVQKPKKDNPPPIKVSCDMATLRSKLLEELPFPTSNKSTKNWLFETIQTPVKIYGDKMPYNYLARMRNIVEEYPGVKFLVTVRDGRAVVASQIRKYNFAINNGDTPSPWMKPTVQEAEYLWLRSAKKWLEYRSNPPAPCLEIFYEQDVKSPENLAKKICTFVGIKYRKKDFQDFLKQYRPVNIDAWREEFKNMEDQLSNEFLDTLEQLGYK